MTHRAAKSRLTEADRAEWLRFARLVRPLPGRDLAPEAPGADGPTAPVPPDSAGGAVEIVLPTARPAVRAVAAPRPALDVGSAPPGLDAASWQRFRSGRMPATQKLDLHGYTAERAYHALRMFLNGAAANQVRCVEVITGRGSGETGGTIRREFPFWLNRPDLRPLILAAAHPHAANPGSVRLLLKRVR
ncbi:MAG: DNA mismatch repair protein MutS [Proteobacteria bacterium]|nr:DNA mismatch repair protein MutS [Pseudomonadota bacterium]